MSTVYAVVFMGIQTVGVVGVFSTEALAQECVKQAPSGAKTMWIESLELDVVSDRHVRTLVRMRMHGTVTDTLRQLSLDRPGFVTWDKDQDLVWTVAGSDREAAIRLVDEERRQIIRDNRWGKAPKQITDLRGRNSTLTKHGY